MKKATKVMALAAAMVMLACTLTACGGSSKGGKLTFGTNAEFPPFEFVTSEGVIDQYLRLLQAAVYRTGEKG